VPVAALVRGIDDNGDVVVLAHQHRIVDREPQ